MKIKFILLNICLLVISGCNSAIRSIQATQIPPLGSATVINETATPVNVLATVPTSSPIRYPTNTVGMPSENSCFKVEAEETPLQNVARGTIVLERGSFPYQTFLVDLTLGNEYKLPSHSNQAIYFGFQISPDQNMLAYIEGLQNNDGQFDKMILWVVNARAEVLQKITFNLPGLYNLRWLGDQNIIFYTAQTPKDGSVLLFNPFTREQSYISNDLPDYYTESHLLPGLGWLIEYSPNLDWGVYFGRVESGKLGFLIRDFTYGQTVWQMMDAFGEYQKPEWSPNGGEVAVVASGHLFLIKRDGTAKPIQVLNGSQQTQVSKVSWSPDGRYLAFWNFSELGIYDSQTNQIINPCVSNEYPDYAIWSSDSQQLVINAYLNEGGMLIDLQNEKAYKLLTIPDTFYPTDWMNSMP
ncbi:MAG: WD40 repeat domain-containing protein [Anaerolineales bacterium]|nr:MAG: WD40 repeat domain-containing protein [Anaerolineales bacterium]